MELLPSDIVLRADGLLNTGRIAESIDLCQKGLEKYPDFPAIYSILIEALIESGEIEKASDICRIALENFPFSKNFVLLSEKIASLEQKKREAEKLASRDEQDEIENIDKFIDLRQEQSSPAVPKFVVTELLDKLPKPPNGNFSIDYRFVHPRKSIDSELMLLAAKFID